MYRLILPLILITFVNISVDAQVKIIFDTDFGGDADDLGALAMLNHWDNNDECDLLAVMCWNVEKYAVSAIDAVNRYYGNDDIKIGVRKDPSTIVDWNHSKVIADQFPHKLNSESVPESTQLYRKILASAQDGEIIIVTVGPLSNIKRLLDSNPDEISDLNGIELIRKKVKEFVIMGGQFPSGENEWNFNGDMPGITAYVIPMIPVPITFSGYEVGLNIKTGEIFNDLNKDTPLYVGFKHFSEYSPWLKDQYQGKIYDNSTYDQTAVLYAVKGGVGTYWDKVKNGYCVPDHKGGNTWIEGGEENHSYLKLLMSDDEMATIIEDIMLGKL